jgi:hypothetical protein
MKTVLATMTVLLLVVAGCTAGSQNDTLSAYSGPKVSGELESDWEKTTVSELESLLGQQLPIPTYLPTNYEFREAYYHQRPLTKPQPITEIIFLISDQQVYWSDNQYTCRIVFSVGWNSPTLGLKMPWAEYVPAVQGRLERKDNEYVLWWGSYGSPQSLGSTLRLRASQSFSKDELVKIAASIP